MNLRPWVIIGGIALVLYFFESIRLRIPSNLPSSSSSEPSLPTNPPLHPIPTNPPLHPIPTNPPLHHIPTNPSLHPIPTVNTTPSPSPTIPPYTLPPIPSFETTIPASCPDQSSSPPSLHYKADVGRAFRSSSQATLETRRCNISEIMTNLSAAVNKILPARDLRDEKIMNLRWDIKEEDRPVFLMIGANTGPTGEEEIWGFLSNELAHWLKIFVEPIPYNYEALVKNTMNLKNAITVNAAIVNDDVGSGSTKMYCFKRNPNEFDLGKIHGADPLQLIWYSMTCSMNVDRLFSGLDSGVPKTKEILEHGIDEFTVPTYTVSDLMKKYAPVSSIYYIQTDVEGFDDRIIASLPFYNSNFSPIIINYEYILLNQTQVANTHHLLRCAKYNAYCLLGEASLWWFRDWEEN